MDAVIPNTPEAETKAEQINHHVAAWCTYYWRATNPGGLVFFKKLASKAFCQVLLHEVSECSWDLATQTVTSPHAQSKMAAVTEFENQDWVQDILQASFAQGATKAYVNPNVAFPFQDNFLVGTIHGANARPANSTNHQAENAKGNNEEVIKILDDKDDDNVSVSPPKLRTNSWLSWYRPENSSAVPPLEAELPPAPPPPPRKQPSCHALPNQCR